MPLTPPLDEVEWSASGPFELLMLFVLLMLFTCILDVMSCY
jgi:hypothetical protein